MQGDHQAPEGFYDITPNQMNPGGLLLFALWLALISVIG
jgi:hypothetical protein